MLKWFRSTSESKKDEPAYHENEWDDFFGFLVNEITDPAKSQDLVLVGKQSSRKPPQERFHSYLLFERYLTNLNLDKQYEKHELREVIYSKFHFLRKGPAFMILFLPEKDARIL